MLRTLDFPHYCRHVLGPASAYNGTRSVAALPFACIKRGLLGRGLQRRAAMKQIVASKVVDIPDDVKFEVKARSVRVKGARGTLTRNFKHLAVDMYLFEEDGQKKLKVEAHFGKRKALAAIRTAISHVDNLMKGVMYGFEYKMRLVYAHFPINANIDDDGKRIEIRNFLGERRVRVVSMLPGVKVERSSAVKDELIISGNDIELVSKSAALINYQCHVRNKDIRKFLDGCYVSDKGFVNKDSGREDDKTKK